MSLRTVLAGLLLWTAGWAAGPVDVRSSFYRGRPVTYHVIGGLAIFEGDIVLGTAEEMEAVRLQAPAPGEKPASAITPSSYRWPGGVVPYTIGSDLPNPQRVLDAIEHWNANTVIRLMPRISQPNWVHFFRLNSNGVCSSSVGMVGRGEQRINLDDACSTGTIIHEIGHAVGLWHEQSRKDRDRYVTVLFPNIDKRYVSNFDQEIDFGEDVGSYDHASIMHYGAYTFSRNGRPTIETIPGGIPIGVTRVLSAGDIDAVRRMYGQPTMKTTIATNPAGLEIIVDGAAYKAPVSFEWPPASTHTLSAPSPQHAGDTRHVFARWSNDAASTQTVTPSETLTVFTANFVPQYRITFDVSPAGGGTVALGPPAADGYYRNRAPVELRAEAGPGYYFLNWSGSQTGAANPKQLSMRGVNQITAVFTRSPPTTIATNPPDLRVLVDGVAYTAPWSFVWEPGSAHTIGVTTPQGGNVTRYLFTGWSDGGTPTHPVTASSSPATYTASFITQHLLTVSSSSGGSVSRSPGPDGGYHDSGSSVELTAAANFGYQFDYWGGDLGGRANPQAVIVDDQRLVTARFRRDQSASFAAVNAASYQPGAVAPGQIVTLFGSNLGPETAAGAQLDSGRLATRLADTRILFDGIAAPLISVQARQSSVIVPFSAAGRTSTLLQVEFRGLVTNTVVLPVTASAPGIFTSDFSGRGQGAILNEDGITLNSASNPAPRGSIVSLYAAGAGQTDPPGEDGKLVFGVLPKPLLPVSVRIGGATAEVHYAGGAPGLVAGVLQVNVRVPENIEPGDFVPVILTVGGASSLAAVTMAVR